MEVVGDPHLLILDRIMLNSLLTDLRRGRTELSLVVSLQVSHYLLLLYYYQN